MDNPETLATLDTNTERRKNARRKIKDEQHGPHQETGVNPEVREVYAALVFYTSRCEQHNHKTWNYLVK
jgi:hypothetical protein